MNIDERIKRMDSYIEFFNNDTVKQLLEIFVNDEKDEKELLIATRTLNELAAPDATQQPLGLFSLNWRNY